MFSAAIQFAAWKGNSPTSRSLSGTALEPKSDTWQKTAVYSSAIDAAAGSTSSDRGIRLFRFCCNACFARDAIPGIFIIFKEELL